MESGEKSKGEKRQYFSFLAPLCDRLEQAYQFPTCVSVEFLSRITVIKQTYVHAKKKSANNYLNGKKADFMRLTKSN